MLVSNQNQIFAGSKINKGKLLLLPMGSLQVASADQVSKTQCIITSNDLVGQVYVVQPWRCDFQKGSGLFIPYWMVKEAAKPEDACLQKHSVKLGPLHIPAYTNKKQIDKGVPCFVSHQKMERRRGRSNELPCHLSSAYMCKHASTFDCCICDPKELAELQANGGWCKQLFDVLGWLAALTGWHGSPASASFVPFKGFSFTLCLFWLSRVLPLACATSHAGL